MNKKFNIEKYENYSSVGLTSKNPNFQIWFVSLDLLIGSLSGNIFLVYSYILPKGGDQNAKRAVYSIYRIQIYFFNT